MLKFLPGIVLGKLIAGLTKFLNTGGGTAAPGYYVSKIYPDLLLFFINQLKNGSIVFTGTNGKTTSTRLLANFYDHIKIDYLHNRAGSNLERGLLSTFLKGCDWSGRLATADRAVWELDEAEFSRSFLKIKPAIVVLLNLFRDQMDRYGETDTTRKKWEKALSKADYPLKIVYNNDDPQIVDLINNVSKIQPIFKSYGFSVKTSNKDSTNSQNILSPLELTLCPECKSRLSILQSTIIGQGRFNCNNCGFKNHIPYLTMNIVQQTPITSSININFTENINKSYTLESTISGMFNFYNLASVILLVELSGFSTEDFLKSLENFKFAFGRQETVIINNKTFILNLIKNPTGFTESLKSINARYSDYSTAGFVLNDNYADGKDVSWIWDVDLFKLLPKRLNSVVVSGKRMYDMAIRLNKAAIPKDFLNFKPSWQEFFQTLSEHASEKDIIIPVFLTYTAMLDLQKYLTNQGIKKNYWSE